MPRDYSHNIYDDSVWNPDEAYDEDRQRKVDQGLQRCPTCLDWVVDGSKPCDWCKFERETYFLRDRDK